MRVQIVCTVVVLMLPESNTRNKNPLIQQRVITNLLICEFKKI